MRKQNGITLVSLVITIIVMLILAGVALSMIMGDSSVLDQAITAVDETENQGEIEKTKVTVLGSFDKSGKYDSSAAFSGIQKHYNLTGTTTSTTASGATVVKGVNSETNENIILTHKSNGGITVQTDDYLLEFDGNGKAISETKLTEGSSNVDVSDADYVIRTKEDMKEFATRVRNGETFEGQLVKLGNNIDLENELFTPIGSYKHDKCFMGTFDGMGFTVSGLSQNTWELDNGYYYSSDCGMGLFGAVENATIKNLNVSAVNISGESAICGTIAAVAGGTTVFENIKISNANVADYQYYAGGLVGWLSGNSTITNCTIDSTVNVAAQWGDFNNCTGGVIGGTSTSATVLMKDCNISARIDGYNDVTSAYQWYAYRNCGMLIGNTGTSAKVGDTTYATAPILTCENVTVTYGTWANYHYCKFSAMAYPFVRCEAGVSNSAYSNPRYGHPKDKNGTEVVDDNHVHNDGEEHLMLLQFDQLYGGGSTGVYGQKEHAGVNVVYNNK